MRAYKIWNLKRMPWGSLSLSKAKSTVQAISACNLERNPNLWQNKQFRAALRASFTGASVTDQQESKEMHSNEWRHWERPAGVHGKLQGGVCAFKCVEPSCVPQCTKGPVVQTGHEPANHSVRAGGAPYTYANKALTLCPVIVDKRRWFVDSSEAFWLMLLL